MRGSKILRVWGIDIFLHYSWWIIFGLLSYNLALDFFPETYPGLGGRTYWLMGILSALLLFVSVLLHELTHSLVAKARKLKVESITLFFFGGVASLPSEDVKPATEFWMALAGPLFSLSLAGLLFLLHQLALPIMWKAVTAYLWQINLVLGLFNLLPGYPLDGGRVFRALLMFHYRDLRKATRIASLGGRFFGGMLVFLGFSNIIFGHFAGLWFVFLGSFLWIIAKNSYEQVVIKEVLGYIPLSTLMTKQFSSLRPSDALSTFFSLAQKSGQDSFVVESKGQFAGIVDLSRIGSISRQTASHVVVASVMLSAKNIKPLTLEDSSSDALRKLELQGLNILPIVGKGKVKYVVQRNKILHRLALEMKMPSKLS